MTAQANIDTQPLARPLRPLHGRADDRDRCHDRERSAAIDPGRPGLLPVEPGLGGERLHDPVRRAAAAVRAPGGPDRPAQDLPDRPGGLHRRLAALRGRADAGHADRRPLRAGRRGRAELGGRAGDDRADVPRARRAGEGDRGVRLRRLRGRLDRPAGRRRPDRGDQLALDLLHQRSHRDRHRPGGAAPGPRLRGHRPQGGRRHPRRHPAHRRPDAGRLQHPPDLRAGLVRDPDPGPGRRSRWR